MSPQSSGPARRTPPRRPAKRLPAAVYWRRRAVVFGTPVVLLIAIVAMFSGGGSKPPQATLTGNTTTPRHTASTPATQSGSCPASSVTVTPSVTNGIAGGPIEIDLAVSTTQTGCTFTMSGSNVAIKIKSASNSLWSSADCSDVIPSGTLVLHNGAPVDTSLSWDGHQSNGHCGSPNPWVGPGSYQLAASVNGSAPTTTNFSLKLPGGGTPSRAQTPKPTPKAKSTATTRPTAKATKTCGDSCP